ncbi:MAG: hypothetical protein U0X75_29000 [Acidobacteriota bacterium]
MSYRFLLYLAIVMLVNGRVLNVAANSNAIQQSPKLHLEVKLVSQFYCKDKEGDKISLRLNLLLRFKNESSSPLILYKHSQDIVGVAIYANQPDISNAVPQVRFAQTVISSAPPLDLDESSPNKHFTIIMPGEWHEVESELFFQPALDETKARFKDLPPGEHQMQVTVITWPDANIGAPELRKRWGRYGYLWSGKVTSIPMLFKIEEHPLTTLCPG